MRFTHISLAPACRCLVSQKHEIPSSPFPKIQGSHWKKSIHFRSVFPCKFPSSPLPSQFSIPKKSPKKKILSFPLLVLLYPIYRVIKPRHELEAEQISLGQILHVTPAGDLRHSAVHPYGRLFGAPRWGEVGPEWALNGEQSCVFLMVKGWVNGGQ